MDMSVDDDVPRTVAAVVFDWAGTVVDFGSHAPMGAFVRLFQNHGVAITVAEARLPMGLPKWDHIRALADQPRVAALWRAAHGGQAASDADIDALYAEFTPMNAAAVREHATLVPGAAEVIAALRARGCRIGSTTGYNRAIMAVLAPLAAAQGFVPDNLVCADDLPVNRPAPLGMYRSFIELAVWPAWRVLKVDDTVPGLLEGRHAGCWTVAVCASGNEMGLTHAQWSTLGDDERAARRQSAAHRLAPADPDFVVDTVADLLPILEAVERQLSRGGRPGVAGAARADETAAR
jgi:phosphonoacetaldehyde hydrolase